MNEWVWSIGGMVLTGGNLIPRRETCHSVTLSTTDPTYTGLGSYLGLRGEMPAPNSVGHGAAQLQMQWISITFEDSLRPFDVNAVCLP
jgi:hypothetical protein